MSAKAGLSDQGHGAVGAAQFKLGQRPAAPDRVDMRGRVIIGVDRNADVAEG